MQILDYDVSRDGPVEYDKSNRRHAKRDFKISFRLRCLKCGLTDTVEISNDGWQGGKIEPGISELAFSGSPVYPISN